MHQHPRSTGIPDGPPIRRLVPSGAVALAIASLTACSGSPSVNQEAQEIEQTQNALLISEVWTMENASRWSITSGSANKQTSTVHSEGTNSLSLAASNVVTVKGSVVSKPTDPMSQVLGIDVMVPSQAGNSNWGTVQLLLDAPAEQVNGYYLGQVMLAPPKGQWQTVSFKIPSDIYGKLASKSFTDLAVSVTLNPQGNSAAYLFDNLRFLPAPGCAGQANGTLCDDAVACTTGSTCTNGVCGSATVPGAGCDLNLGVRGFENPLAWTVSNGTASLMSSTTKVEGDKSLSVVAPYFTTITSIQLSTEYKVSKKLSFWVKIPTSQPSQGWHGDITLNVSVPGLGINDSKVFSLLPLTPGAWSELTFDLPEASYTKMATSLYASLYYSISINPPNGQTGAYLLDDLHFEPVTSCAGVLNYTACVDTNLCTEGDRCFNGTCGTAKVCDDGNVCTDNSCNPSIGCVFTNNTASCNDSNACTTNDTCSNGACVGGPPPNCDDGNLCTDDSCNTTSGCEHTNNTVSCDDGNPCTQTDSCNGGACVGGDPKSCPASDQCHVGSCDVTTGNCLDDKKPNGTVCDDAKSCTQGDTCTDGVCGGTESCPALDQCHTTGACDSHGACTVPNVADWSTCDDGDPATNGEMCVVGTCKVEQKFLVEVTDWQDKPLEAEVGIVDASENRVYTTTSGADGKAYVPKSMYDQYGMGGLRAYKHGGFARVPNNRCYPEIGTTPAHCEIVVGKPVKLTVRKASQPVVGAWISVGQTHTNPDGKGYTPGSAFVDKIAVTDSKGEAVALVRPGKSPNSSGTPTYPYNFVFKATEAGAPASPAYFGEYPCPTTSCDCDVSECLVGGTANDCTDGTINIGYPNQNNRRFPLYEDPTLPEVTDLGHGLTGNGFMRGAADLLNDLANDADNFRQVMRTAFGKEADPLLFNPRVDQLLNEIRNRDYTHAMPGAVVNLHQISFDKKMGAYAKSTQKVYISSRFTGDVGRSMVYQLEFGHFIADFLRDGTILPGKAADAPGYEADIFYLLASGSGLSKEGLEALQKEDDHGVLKFVPWSGDIQVRFGFFDWLGGIGDFLVDGIVDIGGFIERKATTIWNAGTGIIGFVYDTAKGAGGLVYQAYKVAKNLPQEVIDVLEDLAKSGWLHQLNNLASKYTAGIVDLEDLTMPLNILEGVVKDASAGLDGIEGALGKIASGDIDGGFADLGIAIVQTSLGTIEDAVVNIVTDALIIIDGLFVPAARMLNKEEMDAVRPVFCAGVNFSEVRMKSAGPLWGLINHAREDDNGDPRAITLDNDIYLFGVPDTNPNHHTLVHEMTHVWQYQHGGPIYKSIAIDYQMGGSAYDWQPTYDSSPTHGWLSLNPEQQAQLVEDAFIAKFWPNKTEFKFGSPQKDYTSRAIMMADSLVRGVGAPTVLDFPLP